MASTAASPLVQASHVDPTTFETGHVDAVHDAQLDFYGKRLATASSDRTVRLFDVTGGRHAQIAKLEGHEGPVWRVSWAHPTYGSLLATCSFDATAAVWQEVAPNRWDRVYVTPSNLHQSSINAVEWAPHQVGLCFACGSSDGTLSIVSQRTDGGWDAQKIPDAHALGVTSVSWAPFQADGTVIVWTLGDASQDWQKHVVQQVDVPVWSVSWSLTGDILACSDGNNNVNLWKEALDGEWQKLSDSI
eukprot:jgi/Pico_ML_1/53146/g3749.t1